MVDRAAEQFDIDVFSWKEDVLAGLSKGAKNPGIHQALSSKALDVIDEALAQDNFEAAARMGKFAQGEAMKAHDRQRAQQVRLRLKDVETAAKAFVEVEAAVKRLKSDPNNSSDNIIVGTYTCFAKRDWDGGLPLLARSDNGRLKALAEKELKNQVEAGEQLTLAEGWYELSEGEKGTAKKSLQLHAAHWYWRALPELTGLDRTKVEKRMKLLAPLVATLPVPRQVINKRDGSTLVLIPAGKFLAGDKRIPVELPAYYLGLHTVTNARYMKFVEATGRSWAGKRFTPERANLPAVFVSWDDARAYCRWAGLRLPTELEYEKGARGIDGRHYPWGDQWDTTKCIYDARDFQPVDACPEGRSPFGLFQMTSNVMVWCADWYDRNSYARYERGDLTPPTTSSETPPGRVVRGCVCNKTEPQYFGCTRRFQWEPASVSGEKGLRVAKDVMP